MGIMVMQDGSFFSQAYPSYQRFYDLVSAEASYNTKRLARHPSLVVYSGNNEGQSTGSAAPFPAENLLARGH